MLLNFLFPKEFDFFTLFEEQVDLPSKAPRNLKKLSPPLALLKSRLTALLSILNIKLITQLIPSSIN